MIMAMWPLPGRHRHDLGGDRPGPVPAVPPATGV